MDQATYAPTVDLVALARNPVPSGAVVGTFKGFDGAPLRFARWRPTRAPTRGTVCCFTGRSEYIEKYFETTADLRRRGFNVAIMDWRGQGGSKRALSNPRKGHITDFEDYVQDIAGFMKECVLPDCPPPYYALAHSMGGHILLRHASEVGSWFERLVVSAPMLAFHPSRVGAPAPVARAYASVSSKLGFGSLYVRGGSDDVGELEPYDGNPLTSDRERYERNAALAKAAKKLLIASPTVGWLHAAYQSMDMLEDPEYGAKVKIPTLLFVAMQDTIVSPRAIEDFAARLKVGKAVLLTASRHEILQETDQIRADFWAAFDAYLGIPATVA
jgi:lysophospholipase